MECDPSLHATYTCTTRSYTQTDDVCQLGNNYLGYVALGNYAFFCLFLSVLPRGRARSGQVWFSLGHVRSGRSRRFDAIPPID